MSPQERLCAFLSSCFWVFLGLFIATSLLDQETAVVSCVSGRGCVSVSVAVVRHKSEHVLVVRVLFVPVCACPDELALSVPKRKCTLRHRRPETSQPAQVT